MNNATLLDQIFWFYVFTGCMLVLLIRLIEYSEATAGKPAEKEMKFLDHFLVALIWPVIVMIIVIFSIGSKKDE
jgi:membrane protein required for beta-lactamase induction